MEHTGQDSKSRVATIKFRASLFLGLVCFASIFGFLLLIPFVLDPAISTLYYQFVEEPVHCKVTDYKLGVGMKACSWTSCREGCTATIYRCHQIRVVYSRESYGDGASVDDIDSWVDVTSVEEKVDPEFGDSAEREIVVKDTHLLVNVKGCGYPPTVVCDEYAEKYNNYSEVGLTFPCHYSLTNPLIVISSYHYYDNVKGILCSIFIPSSLLAGAIILLIYWACQ